jgi:hypothetical protein
MALHGMLINKPPDVGKGILFVREKQKESIVRLNM